MGRGEVEAKCSGSSHQPTGIGPGYRTETVANANRLILNSAR